jgi:exodeoxyribonuclease VII large subunit
MNFAYTPPVSEFGQRRTPILFHRRWKVPVQPVEPVAISVSALTTQIRQSLESAFKGVWVEGELSNVRMQASGHAYFTLKDPRSQLPAAMFAQSLRGVSFRLADGLKVRALGDVSVYEPRGAYQLIVRQLEKVGAGDLMAQFEELKRKLQAEGLFDPARKRPLPLLPRTVGIVTSPTGAAVRDMLTVTRRRFPNLRILLAPVRVQGDGAAREIAEAITCFNGLPPDLQPDVLIIGRGGGSIEDLWCFNEESVARAIFASRIPVISAVGHEIDFTISDFVADLRAPTPSAAAELVVGRKDDFLGQLAALQDALHRNLRHAVESRRARLERVRSHHVFQQPRTVVRQHAQRIDMLDAQLRAVVQSGCQRARNRLDSRLPRLRMALASRVSSDARRLADVSSRIRHTLALRRAGAAQRVEGLRRQLDALSPLAVLQRGYGVTRGPAGRILRSPEGLSAGDVVTTLLARGTFQASVTGTSTPPVPSTGGPGAVSIAATSQTLATLPRRSSEASGVGSPPPPSKRHRKPATDDSQLTFL